MNAADLAVGDVYVAYLGAGGDDVRCGHHLLEALADPINADSGLTLDDYRPANGAACEVCAESPDACPRGYTDADCDVLCCACHRENRLGDDVLGAECLTDALEDR